MPYQRNQTADDYRNFMLDKITGLSSARAASYASEKKKQEELIEKAEKEEAGKWGDTALLGASLGGMIGSAVPGIGTGIGMAAGAGLGALAGIGRGIASGSSFKDFAKGTVPTPMGAAVGMSSLSKTLAAENARKANQPAPRTNRFNAGLEATQQMMPLAANMYGATQAGGGVPDYTQHALMPMDSSGGYQPSLRTKGPGLPSPADLPPAGLMVPSPPPPSAPITSAVRPTPKSAPTGMRTMPPNVPWSSYPEVPPMEGQGGIPWSEDPSMMRSESYGPTPDQLSSMPGFDPGTELASFQPPEPNMSEYDPYAMSEYDPYAMSPMPEDMTMMSGGPSQLEGLEPQGFVGPPYASPLTTAMSGAKDWWRSTQEADRQAYARRLQQAELWAGRNSNASMPR